MDKFILEKGARMDTLRCGGKNYSVVDLESDNNSGDVAGNLLIKDGSLGLPKMQFFYLKDGNLLIGDPAYRLAINGPLRKKAINSAYTTPPIDRSQEERNIANKYRPICWSAR